jgi:hypothetical protein
MLAEQFRQEGVLGTSFSRLERAIDAQERALQVSDREPTEGL